MYPYSQIGAYSMEHGFRPGRVFDDMQELQRVVGPFYDEHRKALEQIFERSRDPQVLSDPAAHLDVQRQIFRGLRDSDAAVRDGRKTSNGRREQYLKNMRCECISAAYRSIADGLAWRTLDYDRLRIRVLSQAHSPGPLADKEGRAGEIAFAESEVKCGRYALLNDLTTLLRIGDVTVIDPQKSADSVLIVDTKLRGQPSPGKVKVKLLSKLHRPDIPSGRSPNKQLDRLLQAQTHIDTRNLSTNKESIDTVSIRPPLVPDMIGEVKRALARVATNGVYDGFLTPYMHMVAIDLKHPNAKIHMSEVTASLAARADSEELIVSDNYSYVAGNTGGGANRNVLPLTLLPFDAATMVKLLLGEMYMKTTIYGPPLKQAFARLGWQFTYDLAYMDAFTPPPPGKVIAHFSDRELFPDAWNAPGVDAMALIQSRTGYGWGIFSEVEQMSREFTTAEHIAATAEAVITHRIGSGVLGSMYIDNQTDRERWRTIR